LQLRTTLFFKPTMPLDRILHTHGHAHRRTVPYILPVYRVGQKSQLVSCCKTFPTTKQLSYFGTLYTIENLQLGGYWLPT